MTIITNAHRSKRARQPREGCMTAGLPAQIGPCQFGMLGSWITVRCPRDFDPAMRRAGGQWEPGTRRWLIEHRRIWPLIRTLQRTTDPLFRRAGMDLDDG
jgi:hypothetical protein